MLVLGFKLVAGALASCAFIGVAVGVGLIFASLVYSIARNPSQRDELLRYSFIDESSIRCTVITTRAKIIKLNITPTVPTDSIY